MTKPKKQTLQMNSSKTARKEATQEQRSVRWKIKSAVRLDYRAGLASGSTSSSSCDGCDGGI
jgi:hypothetical protein